MCFSKPKLPKTTVAPPPPDETNEQVLEARKRERRKALAMQGRQATILTGPGGVGTTPTLGRPAALGS